MTLADRILDLAVQIQQIPSPTFNEGQRAAFIRDRFQIEKLEAVHLDAAGNVFARLAGTGSSRPVVVSAHSDTVFPLETDLSLRREVDTIHGPGIGDNSLGVAGLFGLVWGLRERHASLAGDVWLVANVCEEGLGDLKGMRAVVERFGERPLAYIVLEGMSLGQVYNRGLGVQRYRISASTEGGHSWVNYGKPSAIHELAGLVTQLAALDLPANPRTSLNVGVIQGGTSVNTIAAQASLELDLRSVDPASLANLARRVENLVARSNREGVNFQAEIIGQRPAGSIPGNHPLVELAMQTLVGQGIQPKLNIGSTDANIPLSRGLPSVCVGLTYGNGAHTVKEYIQTSPLGEGIAQVIDLVIRSFIGLG
jgi:tripeptide aminopeptidase